MDANDLQHIFGNRSHNLDTLVRHFGTWEAAGRALEVAVGAAFVSGRIPINAEGHYEQVFDIAGYDVFVRGRVISETARIGTAWIPRRRAQ